MKKRTNRLCLYALTLFICSHAATAYSSDMPYDSYTNTSANQLNRSSFTLVHLIMKHIRDSGQSTQKHQAGGKLHSKMLDNGSEVVSFSQLGIQNGRYEHYRVNGIFLLHAEGLSDVVNKTPVTVSFVYPQKELTYEITDFRLTIQDVFNNDQDHQLLSYAISYKSPISGNISVKTLEPLKYSGANILYVLSSDKPVSGKIAISNNNKQAIITVLPTPENYTHPIVQVDVDGRSFRDEWRYLDQLQFLALPKGL